MKTINLYLTLIFLMIGSVAIAQSSTSPDSVCAGATGKSYKVNGTAGSTYTWVINGGTQASGGSTDSITVDWSATPGTDTLKVVEFNVIGCPGDTISLAVVRLPAPTATISGTDSICVNSSTGGAPLQLSFTGVGPWTVDYLEDGATRNITTSSNPYTFDSQVFASAGIKNYSISTVSGRLGCSGSGSGSGSVTVFAKPGTSAIFHY